MLRVVTVRPSFTATLTGPPPTGITPTRVYCAVSRPSPGCAPPGSPCVTHSCALVHRPGRAGPCERRWRERRCGVGGAARGARVRRGAVAALGVLGAGTAPEFRVMRAAGRLTAQYTRV